MGQATPKTLKTYFNTGDRPTEDQFVDLIDSTFNDLVSAKAFGVVSDGVTDDLGNMNTAISYVTSNDKTLVIDGDTYISGSLNSISSSNLRIVSFNKSRIFGDGAASYDFIGLDGCSLFIKGLEISDFRYIFDYQASGSPNDITIRLRDNYFYDYDIVIRSQSGQPSGSSISNLVVDNNEFAGRLGSSSASFDIWINDYPINDTRITNNYCHDGGPEAFNLNAANSTRYIFDSNIFYNYLNDKGGPDADGHFIRCRGEVAIISNNVFMDLILASGTVTTDHEALRPTCSKVEVTGNIFIDAGMGEGMVAFKSANNCDVRGNYFEVTDSYNTTAVNEGGYTVAIQAGENGKIIGNTFVNFNGAVVDTQDSISLDCLHIENNTLINCQCDQYSSQQVFRLTAPTTDFYVRGNTVATNASKYPVNIFRLSSNNFYIEGNDFRCTQYVYTNENTSTNINSKGNTFREIDRISGSLDVNQYISADDTIVHSTAPSFDNILGSSQGYSKLVIEKLALDFGSVNGRYLSINPSFDGLGLVSQKYTFKDPSGDVAIDKQETYFNVSGGTKALVGTFLEQEFQTQGANSLTQDAISIVSNRVVLECPDNTTGAGELVSIINIIFEDDA